MDVGTAEMLAAEGETKSPCKSEADAVSQHAEAGHFATPIGSGSSFVDRDMDAAAAIALAEGQDGVGNDMFNKDGSLIVRGVEATGQESAAEAADSPSRLSPVAWDHPPGLPAPGFADSESRDEAHGPAGEAAAGASQPADRGALTSDDDAQTADHTDRSVGQLLREWFDERFGASECSEDSFEQLRALLFAKARQKVPQDLWLDPSEEDTVTVVVSQTYTVQRVRAMLLKREAWLQSQGLPLNHQMDDEQRQVFTAAMKAEYEMEPMQQELIARDMAKVAAKELKKKNVADRKHSRFHRELQRRAGSKQFWEVICFSGRLDIDTLVATTPASSPQPGQDPVDVAARRTVRREAVQARTRYTHAQSLALKRIRIEAGSNEWLSHADHELLRSFDDDSLRTTANRLTLLSGHGTIRDRDGMQAMLGQNTHSITRRVLDSFQPLRMEELDLAQYV